MALLHILLNQIDEARLQELITAGATESRTIDYKRTTYGNAHADYSESLADTSSFANTSGGATNGILVGITPAASHFGRYGHSGGTRRCPLLGVRRTSVRLSEMSASDPKATFGAKFCCGAQEAL
jgi:hypothetical protein